jgi:glutathione S-transferase
MADPVIHGPAFSTYARTARLALEEKSVPYRLQEVAMDAWRSPEHLKRQPFGKVPAFEHDGFALYETGAITRYVDRAFPGPSLQPSDVRQLARMDQVISVIDSYAYPALIGKLVIQRLVVPMMGQQPDEAVIAEALPAGRTALAELERLLGAGPWFCGDRVSLADLALAPIFAYVEMTPEGKGLLEPHAALRAWWDRMRARDSMAKTQQSFG